jgi:ribosome-associated protein
VTPDGALVAAQAAASKTLERTAVLDVAELLGITDAFVVTSGTNPRQVRTIAEEVEKRVREAGRGSPVRVEGLDDFRWVLLDYGDFVVHVFNSEARGQYDLERLWADAERVEWHADAGEQVGT